MIILSQLFNVGGVKIAGIGDCLIVFLTFLFFYRFLDKFVFFCFSFFVFVEKNG